MQYFVYLEDAWANVSTASLVVVFGFSIISASYMKERIGTGAVVLYFPVMVACALLSNFIFWHFQVFPSDGDVELAITATITGMIFCLLLIIVINNIREAYWRVPVKRREYVSPNDV